MPVTQGAPAELYNDAVPIPTYCDAKLLAANTAESFTVPAGAYFAIFSPSSAITDYSLSITGAAVTAVADVSDGTACIPNLGYARVSPGQTVSIISPQAGVVVVAWFRGPQN